MAVDTSRERLERLYHIAGERRLWGRTWAVFVVREPNRVIVRSKAGSQTLFKVVAVIAAVALFGIYPSVAALQQLRDSIFPWGEVTSCDGLRYRYEVARDAIGAPKAGPTRADFLSARRSCERHAETLPTSAKSVSCHAAIRTYVRAFRRAEAGGTAPTVSSGIVGSARVLRQQANEVLDVTDLQTDERLASSYLDACNG